MGASWRRVRMVKAKGEGLNFLDIVIIILVII
jgi:hypothetical protein